MEYEYDKAVLDEYLCKFGFVPLFSFSFMYLSSNFLILFLCKENDSFVSVNEESLFGKD